MQLELVSVGGLSWCDGCLGGGVSGLVLPGTNTVTFPHPFVVSLSNLERSHFDKLSANDGSQ